MTEKPVDERAWIVKHKRFLFSVVLVFLLSLLLSGCFLGHSAWWKEEVLLHDGQTIIVDRSRKLGGYRYPDSRNRSILEEKWNFPVPGTYKFVTWKINQELPPKGYSLSLLVLGFVQGAPYIATSPAGCISYNYWGRPNPPYVFFRYDGKTWQRIKLEEFPMELTETNVVVGSPKPKKSNWSAVHRSDQGRKPLSGTASEEDCQGTAVCKRSEQRRMSRRGHRWER